MKKLIINFFFLCLFLFPLLYLCNYITDYGLRKSKMDIYAQWTDIYNSNVNADMLFSGASRTVFEISPRIVDSMLHINSYNIGISGWTFNMQFARFKFYLEHNTKPKYIIQNVDFHTFGRRLDLFEYEQFLPYLYDTIIQNVTNECEGRFTLPEIYFPLFKYNNHLSLVKEGINCYFNTGKQYVSKKYKGFQAHQTGWNGAFDKFKAENPKGITSLSSEKTLQELDEFLTYCKANDIQVIFDFAPVYFEEMLMENNAAENRAMIEKYVKKYNLIYLDYSQDSICYDKKYFYDSQHLNATGADLFSAMLANDLKKILNK